MIERQLEIGSTIEFVSKKGRTASRYAGIMLPKLPSWTRWRDPALGSFSI
jgi:hypothetical protein